MYVFAEGDNHDYGDFEPGQPANHSHDHAQNSGDQMVDDADDEFEFDGEGRGGLGEFQDIYSTTQVGSSSNV